MTKTPLSQRGLSFAGMLYFFDFVATALLDVCFTTGVGAAGAFAAAGLAPALDGLVAGFAAPDLAMVGLTVERADAGRVAFARSRVTAGSGSGCTLSSRSSGSSAGGLGAGT